MISLDEIFFDEEPHTYTYRGKRYESVTQVIRLAGLGDDFSHVPQDRMEYAQRRGRMVHLATQYIDEDGKVDMDTVHPTIRGYVEAYMLFRSDRPMKVIEVEKKMVDPGLGLAGTPDLICFMGGRRSVIDKKTSQHMSKSMGLQTVGYQLLWNALHPTQPVYERYGLRLEKTGKYKLVHHQDPDDVPAFVAALQHTRSVLQMKGWTQKYK